MTQILERATMVSAEPSVRFRSFQGEWKVTQLGDVSRSIASGRTKHSASGPVEVYGSTGLIGWADEATHDGEFILVARVGANAGLTKRVEGKFAVTDNTLVIDLKESVNASFIEAALHRFDLNQLVFGSGQPLVTGGQLKALKLHFPTLPEQQKIAAFLGAVDRKIQQLKRKQALLEQYKKGVVQQLFAQELRFKREDGGEFPEWEEKRLGDVVTFTKGKGVSKSDIVEGGATKCIRYGELYTTYSEVIDDVVSSTNVDPSLLLLSKKNDVIIPASGETQLDIATASCVMHDGIALGGDLNVMRTKENGVFLAYYLNGAKRQAIAELAQGNSVVHLYAKQLQGISINLPSLEEQSRIAGFLMALDAKVAGVAQAVAACQKWKKGLLQQMFV